MFEIKMMQLRKTMLVFSGLEQVGLPLLVVLRRSTTILEIYLKMYEILRPLLIIPKFLKSSDLKEEFDNIFTLNGEFNP